MSFLPATTSTTITVTTASSSLKIGISSPSPWAEGKSYTITVSYYSQIACYTYESESFTPTVVIQYSNGASQTLTASGTISCGRSGTSGNATVTWTPNNSGNVSIYATYNTLQSNTITGVVGIPTSFTNIQVLPSSSIPAGSSFQVTGQLVANGSGVANQTVTATFNGQTYSATTDSNGNFAFNLTAPSTAGTYTITISYAGNLSAGLLPASVSINMTSGLPSFQIPQDLLLGIGLGAAALALAGASIYFAKK